LRHEKLAFGRISRIAEVASRATLEADLKWGLGSALESRHVCPMGRLE
jgi:hypothetical protein